MVAAQPLRAVALLVHRGPAELAAPDDERLVEKPALLEVLDQGGDRLVRFLAAIHQAVADVVRLVVAVLVPAPVVKLDEADAALDQPARQQAVVGERFLARAGCRTFRGSLVARAAMSMSSRHAGLHLVGHLVLRDPREDLGVAHGVEMELIERLDLVDRPPALLPAHAGGV